jgi:hypothetical protein
VGDVVDLKCISPSLVPNRAAISLSIIEDKDLSLAYQKAQSAVGVTVTVVVVGGRVVVDVDVTTVQPLIVEQSAFKPAKVHTWQPDVTVSFNVEMLVVWAGNFVYAHDSPG